MITLQGMTWDHPRGYDPMVATSALYSQAHPDVTIAWEKRSLADFEALPIEEMAGRFDLMVIDHPHVGSVARNGLLAAFDGKELADIEAGSVGPSFASYVFQGRPWALPIDAAAPVSAYRPDALDAPPQSWDAVIELAQKAPIVLPLNPVHSLMAFMGLAANCKFALAESPDGFIGVTDGTFVLDALSAVARHLPTACFSMNPIDAYEAMSQTDGPVYCPHGYGYVSYALDGFRDRRLRFADFPALGNEGIGGSVLGGTGIAVSALSQHREAAMDYALWVAGAQCQTGPFFAAGGQPGHAHAWEDEAINAATHGFFADTRESLENAWLRPRHDGYLAFQEKGGEIVNAFVRGDAAAEITLNQLNATYRDSFSNDE